MKRFVLAIASLLCLTAANAQIIGGYKATTKQDIALQGATVINKDIAPSDLKGMVILSNASAGSYDTAEGKGFPIGFEFPFNGKNFSYFGVGANGLINLSETEEMTMDQSNYFVTQSKETFDNLIYCYDLNAVSYDADNAEGIEPTTISYKTTDEGLIVEWKNLGINTSSWGTNLKGAYTMQIHLLKDGTIKYRFAGLDGIDADDEAGKILLGVRGGDGEYICFKDLSAKESVYGTTNYFSLTPVVDGYTLTLNTPEPTVTPTAQPTNLETKMSYSDGTVSATMTFDNAEGVDNYLMLISEGAPAELPVDGTFYAKEESLGNAQVILAGRQGTWGTSAYNLKHNTEYTVTVYAYNSFGTEGPKYNTVEPLQGIIATAPAAPGELTVVATSATSIKVNAAANEEGQKIFVAYSKKTSNPNNYGNRAFIGAFDATSQVGDKLLYEGDEEVWNDETFEMETIHVSEETGVVAYFGEAGEFEITDLEPSTSYYFIAYSFDEATGTFSQGSDFSQVWTSTNIQVPYELNLDETPVYECPGGWIATPGGYNDGFNVDRDLNYSKVKSQTEGNYVFVCQNMDNSETYKLASPTIEICDDCQLSVDWHVHTMAGMSFWMRKAALYEEWYEDDLLEFVVYDGEERVVLKTINTANAPINENVYDEDETYDSSLDWHSENFDLTAYAGKNIKFGIEWKGANSSTLYFGVENIKVAGSPEATAISSFHVDNTSAGTAVYNLKGQRIPAAQKGVNISEGRKFIK